MLSNLYNESNGYKPDAVWECWDGLYNKGKIMDVNGVKLKNNKLVKQYIDYCISLFESIQKDGFVVKGQYGFIEVGVSGNYELIKTIDSRHRFAVSKILNINAIPFKIKTYIVIW